MIEAVEGQMLKELLAVKEQFTRRLKPMKADRVQREEDLLTACQAAREKLFEPGVKTIKVAAGEVSVREKPPRLEIREGWEEEDVINSLKGQLVIYVRTKLSVDRQGLKEAILGGELKRERLAGLGLALIEHEEEWAVKPDLKAVREAVGRP